MPIKLPMGIPSGKVLENESIFVMTRDRAYHQDIRPLHILFINLMPNKQDTEAQFFRLISNSPLQVEAHLIYTASYEPKHTTKKYLGRYYQTFQDISDRYFDGMIVTGAPVELMEFEDVHYWEELCRIMEWSKTHVFSSMYVCWGAQAALQYFHGVPKYRLPEKCFGVYEHHIDTHPHHEFLRGVDDLFYVPVSRYTEVRTDDIKKAGGLEILASSRDAGAFAVEDPAYRRFYLTGHVEYDRNTLKNEYERDIRNGKSIHIPRNYFPDDDPSKEPLVRWRSTANLIMQNWLNYFVYQQTPYDLEGIGRPKTDF